MSLTKFLFKQIDYWGYIPQNTYHNKNVIKLAENRVYFTDNDKFCTLDLYCNKDTIKEQQPVFINLHGGGFVAGDKKYRKSFSEYVARHNVKVLNINYPLAPHYNLLQILEQLSNIFNWIKDNSALYGLDTSKIILCGDSAGAYLATCLTALCNNEQYVNAINLSKIDTKITGLVLFSGMYFPTDALDEHMILNINHSLWEYLCGEKFINIETCKQNKMYNFIDVGNFINDKFPPTFVSYSDNDIFCKGNGEKFINQLQANNIPYFAVHSKNNMHDWQENMFTKSAKLTLLHFDKFMTNLLNDNLQSNNTITISHGKIKKT